MVSDVIVLYVLKKRYFYREKKYLYVADSNRNEDQYEVITEPEEADERVWGKPFSLAMEIYTVIYSHLFLQRHINNPADGHPSYN